MSTYAPLGLHIEHLNKLLVISTNSKTYSSKFEHSKTTKAMQEQNLIYL